MNKPCPDATQQLCLLCVRNTWQNTANPGAHNCWFVGVYDGTNNFCCVWGNGLRFEFHMRHINNNNKPTVEVAMGWTWFAYIAGVVVAWVLLIMIAYATVCSPLHVLWAVCLVLLFYMVWYEWLYSLTCVCMCAWVLHF